MYPQKCCEVENTLLALNSPGQNGRHFPDDIFKCIFLNENVWISIKISLMFVPKGPINNIPVLAWTMAWHRPGDKPLSKPQMVSILAHICVTQPLWVNSGPTMAKTYEAWLLSSLSALRVPFNKLVAKIQQCTNPISHNASFCNRNVHICAHFCYKMVHCGIFVKSIVGYLSKALWDLWDGFIVQDHQAHRNGKYHQLVKILENVNTYQKRR